MAKGRSTATAFRNALVHWVALVRNTHRPKSALRLHVGQMRRAKASRTYLTRHPEYVPTFSPSLKKGKKSLKQWRHEFFMENNDDILSVNGSDLNMLAEHFEVDQKLPEKTKQEEVYQAMADAYVHDDSRWTKDRIVREKKRFLEIIKGVHFVNLTCSMANIKESIVRTWIRSDPDFAEGIRSAQVRFGERVAHAMMEKAVGGDLGAQMYTLKQFGDSVNFIDPEVSERAGSSELQVDKLTLEEQETLLYLMRKTQQDGTVASDGYSIEKSSPLLAISHEREFIEAELPDVDLRQADAIETDRANNIKIEFDGD